MQMILSQSSPNVFEVMGGVFSRADTLAHPKDLMGHLQHLGAVWAAIFLAAGIVCLLQGYRFHKWVTVSLALLIGVFAGYFLGKQINAEYIVAG